MLKWTSNTKRGKHCAVVLNDLIEYSLILLISYFHRINYEKRITIDQSTYWIPSKRSAWLWKWSTRYEFIGYSGTRNKHSISDGFLSTGDKIRKSIDWFLRSCVKQCSVQGLWHSDQTNFYFVQGRLIEQNSSFMCANGIFFISICSMVDN